MYEEHSKGNEGEVKELENLSDQYDKAVVEEQGLAPAKRAVANVGKMDAKKHLQASIQALMARNITQCMGTMLDTNVF